MSMMVTVLNTGTRVTSLAKQPAGTDDGSRASKAFFFEKKKQKTFNRCRGLSCESATAVQKFFASFFKKEGLAFF